MRAQSLDRRPPGAAGAVAGLGLRERAAQSNLNRRARPTRGHRRSLSLPPALATRVTREAPRVHAACDTRDSIPRRYLVRSRATIFARGSGCSCKKERKRERGREKEKKRDKGRERKEKRKLRNREEKGARSTRSRRQLPITLRLFLLTPTLPPSPPPSRNSEGGLLEKRSCVRRDARERVVSSDRKE